MGCGCGLVGLLIATRFSRGGDLGDASVARDKSPQVARDPQVTLTPQVARDPQVTLTPQVARDPHAPLVASSISLTLVDSHSRAVEAARENAAKFGVEAEVILSDNGTPARLDGTFDVFVGNPPYYSDYRIAEVFLETAKRALKPGGVCYQVVKNAANLEPVQKKFFPEVEIIHRRNYAILKSVNHS